MASRKKRQPRAGTNAGRNQPREPQLAQEVAPSPHGRLMIALAALIITIVTIVAYISSFQGAFVFDDVTQIVKDTTLRGDGAVMRMLEKSDRPIVEATFAMNLAWGESENGQQIETFGFHVVNLIIHIGAALALFGVVRRTLLLPRFEGRFSSFALPIAFAIAAIWAVHPLNTQAVTYIVQRAESLMGLCYLLTLYCYIRGATTQKLSIPWYIGCVVICALGMASKAVMITAPLVILLYDYCFLTRSWMTTLRKRWIVLLGQLASISILSVIGVMHQIFGSGLRRASVGFSYQDPNAGTDTWWQYFLTQPRVILQYIKLSFWPSPLVLDYQWGLTKTIGESMPWLVIVGVFGLASLWLLWKKPAIGFLACAFFIILAPTSSIIPIKDPIFEHRMYLPLICVIALVVFSLFALIRQSWTTSSLSLVLRRAMVAVPLFAVIVALAATTHARNLDYQSAETMWRDVVAKEPGNARAMNNLAGELTFRARTETDPARRMALRSEACTYFSQVVNADLKAERLPRRTVYYNYANCLKDQGDLQGALPYYDAAVKEWPRFLEAQIMYGNALSRLNRNAEAAERFRIAAEIGSQSNNPTFQFLAAQANYNRGNELFRMKQFADAIEAYTAAASASTEYTKAWYYIGRSWESLGNVERARQAYQTMLKFDPDHSEARSKLEFLEQSN